MCHCNLLKRILVWDGVVDFHRDVTQKPKQIGKGWELNPMENTQQEAEQTRP